jgi:hypothetical protein
MHFLVVLHYYYYYVPSGLVQVVLYTGIGFHI